MTCLLQTRPGSDSLKHSTKSLTPHGVGLCCVEEGESLNKKHVEKYTRHEEKDVKILKTRVLHLEIGLIVRGAMLK